MTFLLEARITEGIAARAPRQTISPTTSPTRPSGTPATTANAPAPLTIGVILVGAMAAEAEVAAPGIGRPKSWQSLPRSLPARFIGAPGPNHSEPRRIRLTFVRKPEA